MTFQERIGVMQEYRNLAERFLREGQNAVAGEILWGVVHNVIQAIGIRHNLHGDRDEVRRVIVIHHLMDVHGYDISLRNTLRTAGELHGHFYNRNVAESRLLMELIPATQQYIDTLVGIAETPLPA